MFLRIFLKINYIGGGAAAHWDLTTHKITEAIIHGCWNENIFWSMLRLWSVWLIKIPSIYWQFLCVSCVCSFPKNVTHISRIIKYYWLDKSDLSMCIWVQEKFSSTDRRGSTTRRLVTLNLLTTALPFPFNWISYSLRAAQKLFVSVFWILTVHPVNVVFIQCHAIT